MCCADAIVVTGTSAFSASQQVLGGLFFHTVYEHRPLPEIADPATCLPNEFNKYKTNALIRNSFRRALRRHVCSLVQYTSSLSSLQ